MGVLHPDAVLHQEGGVSSMPPPACEHYAGDEKKLRKALALQDEMQGAFDVTADMEDGAPSGAEAETAALLSRILAEPRAETRRVGARVHPVDHPAFRNDVATLIAAKPAGLAYLTVPKIAGLSQFQEAIEWIESQSKNAGIKNPIPLQIMFEDEAGLHDVFEIASHPQVQFLAFGQMDFTSSHRGAIPVTAMKSPGQFDHPLLRRAKLEISAAAHAHGKIPTHNPTTDFGSPTQALEDAGRARNEFGFTRMWSIHPNQIAQILKAFQPTAQELEDACRILLAAQAADWGPIADRGLLHDRASYRYFWTLLKRANQAGLEIPAAAKAAFF
jgi:citrate lyase subunit beta/citryl-CoA lyase